MFKISTLTRWHNSKPVYDLFLGQGVVSSRVYLLVRQNGKHIIINVYYIAWSNEYLGAYEYFN